MSTIPQPSSQRTTVRRGKNRAVYEHQQILDVLGAGVVAHVGVTTDDGPIVLPMAYGILDGQILIHGALANALLSEGRDVDVCLTVTIVDGLVVARTPFHNSMNYRCVVIRGTATAIDDPDEKIHALHIINDHITPIWDTARAPSASDVRKTLVLSIPLEEASAKIRAGDPIDEDIDMDGPHWAGVIPLTSTWGRPIPAGDLAGSPSIPDGVASLSHTDAH